MIVGIECWSIVRVAIDNIDIQQVNIISYSVGEYHFKHKSISITCVNVKMIFFFRKYYCLFGVDNFFLYFHFLCLNCCVFERYGRELSTVQR